jgi:hypothetical protein
MKHAVPGPAKRAGGGIGNRSCRKQRISGAVAGVQSPRRVPRPYSAVAVVFCIADVASNGLLELHHGWSVRGVQMGFAAVLCGLAYYWVFRRTFLLGLGRPWPRQGLDGWLVTLPGWLIVLAFQACWLVLLAITAAVMTLIHLSGEGGALLAVGILSLLLNWASAGALLEQRRRGRLAGSR